MQRWFFCRHLPRTVEGGGPYIFRTLIHITLLFLRIYASTPVFTAIHTNALFLSNPIISEKADAKITVLLTLFYTLWENSLLNFFLA